MIGIYAALSGATKEFALNRLLETSGEGPSFFTAFKRDLTAAAIARLSPIRSESLRIMDDVAEIDRILANGAARARAIARPVMDQVKDLAGLIRS